VFENMECEKNTYDDEKLVPAIHTLDQLIAELHKVFDSDRVNVDYVKALLSSYTSKPKDWRKFAKFDTHRYTRNLIDAGNGKFNLMALCWGEGHGSSIHDHSDSHCFVKILQGDLKETMYEWPESKEGEEAEGEMKKKDCNVYHKDQVTYINDTMGLHRMENPSHTDGCISMHLYSPPFSTCRTFDERTGHKQEVMVTFWSQYGERSPLAVGGVGPGIGGQTCCSDINGDIVPADPENN